MEAIIDFFYQIPVLGYLFQFVGYFIDRLPIIAPITLAAATPVALGAMCGLMNERSGIVNIGIEGMMLTGAFAGFMAALLVHEAWPDGPTLFMGITPALLIGVVVAMLASMTLSLLHAWLSISIRADQIISGTIINIGALGLTSYVNRLLSPTGGAGTFDDATVPAAIQNLPVVGWLITMFVRQGPIAMSVVIIIVVMQILLFRSRWGLRTRAVGEHPRAADTVGIDVIRLRYRNVIMGGIFAGLAGAYLTLEATSSFQNGMTAGRGFIALAALIFGRWTPFGAFGAALLFMGSVALGTAIRVSPPPGDLGVALAGIQQAFPSLYNNFFAGLPYLITIIVLAGVVGRSIAPAAVGQPYEKEGKGA